MPAARAVIVREGRNAAPTGARASPTGWRRAGWSACRGSTPAPSPAGCATAARCGRRCRPAPPRSPTCSSWCGASPRCSARRSRPASRGEQPESVPALGARARPRGRARLRRQVLDRAAAVRGRRAGDGVPVGLRRGRRCWRPGRTAWCSANGPGDPAALPRCVEIVRDLVGAVPLLGICLGHQLLGQALGLETFKLRFGHRGANHPVLELDTGRVLVTAQNHGFAVRAARSWPRLRDRASGAGGSRTRRSTTAPSRGSSSGAAGGLGAVPPRGQPRPARRPRDPDRVRRRARAGGAEGRCLGGPTCERRRDRLRADRDRPGVRVRLLGQPGAARAARRGLRTVLINSNPATIMTDGGWADRTYLEPLDVEGVAAVLRRERPDALLPTLGGQTALNLASDLHAAGMLEELGVELIGASYDAIRRAEDRELFAATMAQVGLRVPRERDRHQHGHGARRARVGWAAAAGRRAARVHARRPRRRLRPHAGRARVGRRPRAAREPDRPGAPGGVGGGVGRVRARGDPRPQRQRRRRVLDRERRPDGRAHRRLGDGRAGADAVRPRVPASARRRGGRDPRRRRRDRRLERPVRPEPRAAATWS